VRFLATIFILTIALATGGHAGTVETLRDDPGREVTVAEVVEKTGATVDYDDRDFPLVGVVTLNRRWTEQAHDLCATARHIRRLFNQHGRAASFRLENGFPLSRRPGPLSQVCRRLPF
jgi:hypothetical protein